MKEKVILWVILLTIAYFTDWAIAMGCLLGALAAVYLADKSWYQKYSPWVRWRQFTSWFRAGYYKAAADYYEEEMRKKTFRGR